MRRFKENKKDFDAETKKKFITILQQVAMAYDGISRKEKDLLKRCRRDIAIAWQLQTAGMKPKKSIC